jgi:hypothetical protein
MVFGLMAFSPVAHAEIGAKWLILDSTGTVLTNLEASLGLEKESRLQIHAKIGPITILWGCQRVSGVNMTLKANGSIGAGAKIKFSECVTELNGSVTSACEPKAGGTESGVINTTASHGLVVLVVLTGGTKDDLVKWLPDTGETFAFVEMGPECPIGEKVPIIGKVAIKDCEGHFLTHLVKHLMQMGSKAEGTELWVISKTVEHETTISGSFWAFLTGAHTGLLWGADPA